MKSNFLYFSGSLNLVKPGIPTKVEIHYVQETSMEVEWYPPKHMYYEAFTPGLQYSIQYQALSKPEDPVQVCIFNIFLQVL